MFIPKPTKFNDIGFHVNFSIFFKKYYFGWLIGAYDSVSEALLYLTKNKLEFYYNLDIIRNDDVLSGKQHLTKFFQSQFILLSHTLFPTVYSTSPHSLFYFPILSIAFLLSNLNKMRMHFAFYVLLAFFLPINNKRNHTINTIKC